MEIRTVESLDQLLDHLQSLHNEQEEQEDCTYSVWPRNIFEEHRIDITRLPTFGGVPPSSTVEIWSWDKTRYLISDDNLGFKIVSRKFLDVDNE